MIQSRFDSPATLVRPVGAIPSGNLQRNHHQWDKLYPQSWASEVVKKGLKQQWKSLPTQETRPHIHLTKEDVMILDEHMKQWLREGTVSILPQKDQTTAFFSNLFVVRQPNKNRPCLDLSELNDFIQYSHFKMEGIDVLKTSVQRKDKQIKVDLKDAYHHISIHPSERKYFAFRWREKNYQWNVVPFGLCSAPRIFTKLIRTIISTFRSQGMRSVFYLDDFIIMDKRQNCQEFGEKFCDHLTSLGFVLNMKKGKTCLSPSTTAVFLGFKVNTENMTLSLPRDKLRTLQRDLVKFLKKAPTARQLASMIGKLNACALAVYPTRIKLRSLQIDLNQHLLRSKWSQAVCLSHEAITDLIWWRDNMSQWNGTDIIPQEADLTLTTSTDASKTGWGIHSKEFQASGHFTKWEAEQSSNYRELKTALFARS
jgi:hypothetical protein